MRVLVVEDERRLAAGLRNGLAAEGFAVDVALDGTDGCGGPASTPNDAIVLDIMLLKAKAATPRSSSPPTSWLCWSSSPAAR